jgi:hypothetical protein
MKKFIISLLIISIFLFIIYPKFKTYQEIKKVEEVLKAHNVEYLCDNITPIKSIKVTYHSSKKNDTGEMISFTCTDREGHLINGMVQYHDNHDNKNAYLEYSY